MSIQYSGTTIVNTTFTTTTGTRQEIVNGIAAALLSAGWTQVAGTVGSADQTFKSGTTPQGYAIRVRLLEPGTGSCAQMFLHNATGSVTQTTLPAYLLPSAGGTWRFVGSAYQFFVFVPGPPSGARNFAAAGVPYVPSFLSPTAIGWLMSAAQSDTDTTVRGSFRTSLGSFGGNVSGTAGNYALLLGGTLWTGNGATQGITLFVLEPAYAPGNPSNVGPSVAYRWGDNSIPISDALVGWPATTTSDEIQIRGQLWDAVVIGDGFTADTPATFDSHNWFCITHGNIGGTTTYSSFRGSVFVVVP